MADDAPKKEIPNRTLPRLAILRLVLVSSSMWACVGWEVLASLTVGVGTPECSHSGPTLSCDYYS